MCISGFLDCCAVMEDYIQEYIEDCNKEVMLHNQHLANDPMFS